MFAARGQRCSASVRTGGVSEPRAAPRVPSQQTATQQPGRAPSPAQPAPAAPRSFSRGVLSCLMSHRSEENEKRISHALQLRRKHLGTCPECIRRRPVPDPAACHSWRSPASSKSLSGSLTHNWGGLGCGGSLPLLKAQAAITAVADSENRLSTGAASALNAAGATGSCSSLPQPTASPSLALLGAASASTLQPPSPAQPVTHPLLGTWPEAWPDFAL